VLQKQATAGTVACSYCCSATHTLAAVHGHAPTYPSGFEYLSLLHVSLPDRLYPSPLNACLVTCTPPGAEEMSASSRPRPLYSQAVPSRALQLSQFPVSHPRSGRRPYPLLCFLLPPPSRSVAHRWMDLFASHLPVPGHLHGLRPRILRRVQENDRSCVRADTCVRRSGDVRMCDGTCKAQRIGTYEHEGVAYVASVVHLRSGGRARACVIAS
jgi:hypothetical protein